MSGFNLSALAVRERGITLFLILAIMLTGIFAYLNLGRAEDPTFTVKVLTVTAAWPGATAQEMQDLVADPLEKRLQELRWYDHVDTFTRPGLALMTLYLRDQTPPAEVPEQSIKPEKSWVTKLTISHRERRVHSSTTSIPTSSSQCMRLRGADYPNGCWFGRPKPFGRDCCT
jgi:AcrB/AcrD/AcrF family